MKFLNLFTAILKIMRVFFILVLIYIVFDVVVEIYFDSSGFHTFFSHRRTQIEDSYFNKATWVIIISLSAAAAFVCFFQICNNLLSAMSRFKIQEYFVAENAKNFKRSSIYFLIAMVVIPSIIYLIRGFEWYLSLDYKETSTDNDASNWFFKAGLFAAENIPRLTLMFVIGLFLYVIGEVIQKAIEVKAENDLTI